MTDLWFVVAGWAVIVGGAALYALTLIRRLQAARARSLRIRREAFDAPLHEEGE
jgi:uncharacterized membrane protein